MREKINNNDVMDLRMSKFIFCRPDFKNGLIWCQFPSGTWAPPFLMSKTKEKPPKEISLNDLSEENKPQQ